MKKTVVGIGELLWDILPDDKAAGGAPCNFAYHVSKSGRNCRGAVVSAVGNDMLGKELADVMKKRNIELYTGTVEYPTGTVEVVLDENGKPEYNICRDVAWDHIGLSPEIMELAARTDAVCFGTLAQRSKDSREAIRAFIRAVPRTAIRIFDINLRQNYFDEKIIAESLHIADILKINDEEVGTVRNLLGFAGDDDATFSRRLIDNYGLIMVIETKGEHGGTVFTADNTYTLPAPKVAVADTVGAGDSFTGAFIASLLDGYPISECLRTAVETAAYVCSRPGAMPDYPVGRRISDTLHCEAEECRLMADGVLPILPMP